MIPEYVKQVARQGGWVSSYESWIEMPDIPNVGDKGVYNDYAVAFDPFFWRALDKDLGWGSVCDIEGHPCVEGRACNEQHACSGIGIKKWMYYARLFFDMVLTVGDDSKDFWHAIVKNGG